jgi:hypothetical protein
MGPGRQPPHVPSTGDMQNLRLGGILITVLIVLNCVRKGRRSVRPFSFYLTPFSPKPLPESYFILVQLSPQETSAKRVASRLSTLRSSSATEDGCLDHSLPIPYFRPPVFTRFRLGRQAGHYIARKVGFAEIAECGTSKAPAILLRVLFRG